MIRRLTFEKVLVAPDATGVSRASGDYMTAVRDRRDAMKRILQALRNEDESEAEVLDENSVSDAQPSEGVKSISSDSIIG